MKKKLYMIGGTMGVGKTAASQKLKTLLDNSAFLDGDWCWDMHPFQVTDETKEMVLTNISCLLRSFLRCSVIENVVFCWVMHEQPIIDGILSRLDLTGCDVKLVSLTCRAEVLRGRLQRDVSAGLRTPDVIERSLVRLPLYSELDTIKIDTSELSVEETARMIAAL